MDLLDTVNIYRLTVKTSQVSQRQAADQLDTDSTTTCYHLGLYHVCIKLMFRHQLDTDMIALS